MQSLIASGLLKVFVEKMILYLNYLMRVINTYTIFFVATIFQACIKNYTNVKKHPAQLFVLEQIAFCRSVCRCLHLT